MAGRCCWRRRASCSSPVAATSRSNWCGWATFRRRRPRFPPSRRCRCRPRPPRRRPRRWGSPRQRNLEFFNGLGGFDDDGREYVIALEGGQTTPAPWINVIANSRFGFQVSADGAGYTWCGNSRDHQLTPWSNDPVSDPPGEALYLRDLDTRRGLEPDGFAYSRRRSLRRPPRLRLFDVSARRPRDRLRAAAVRAARHDGESLAPVAPQRFPARAPDQRDPLRRMDARRPARRQRALHHLGGRRDDERAVRLQQMGRGRRGGRVHRPFRHADRVDGRSARVHRPQRLLAQSGRRAPRQPALGTHGRRPRSLRRACNASSRSRRAAPSMSMRR